MKRFTIKSYNKDGSSFLGVLADTSDYRFTKTINGGIGQLIIPLPRRFDNYDDDELIQLMNELRIFVQDIDAPSGTRLYSGYIDEITTSNQGGVESVIVTAVGYVSRLSFSPVVDGTKFSWTLGADDPEDYFTDLIDKFRSLVSDERINYTSDSHETAGFDVNIDFNQKQTMDAIDILRETTGADWYWYVDEDNIIYFKEKPSTPTHIFTFDKDVAGIATVNSSTDIRNNAVIYNLLQEPDADYINERYHNASSASDYFERYEFITDGRIKDDTDYADNLGEAYINAFKNPNVSTVLAVKDNNLGQGYDIESINPGDTCSVRNLAEGNQLEDNMLITRVDYSPEVALVYLQDLRELTSRSLTDIRRQLDNVRHDDAIGNFSSTAV